MGSSGTHCSEESHWAVLSRSNGYEGLFSDDEYSDED